MFGFALSPYAVAAEDQAVSAGRAPPFVWDFCRHEQALRGILADIAAEEAAAERRCEALAGIAAEERRREGASGSCGTGAARGPAQIAIAAAVSGLCGAGAAKEPFRMGLARAKRKGILPRGRRWDPYEAPAVVPPLFGTHIKMALRWAQGSFALAGKEASAVAGKESSAIAHKGKILELQIIECTLLGGRLEEEEEEEDEEEEVLPQATTFQFGSPAKRQKKDDDDAGGGGVVGTVDVITVSCLPA